MDVLSSGGAWLIFGDATSHAAILGVALAIALDIDVLVGVLAVTIIMSLLIANAGRMSLATDTVLGVAAHGALAFGLVCVSLMHGVRVDLHSYLFGDILSLSIADVLLIWIGVAVILSIIIWRWDAMLTSTLNHDLASVEGQKPDQERLILSLVLAILVAVSLKVVGALLITAMLIIPAATARHLANTPEKMAIAAACIGMVAVVGGLQMATFADTPAGPSIVAVSTSFFMLVQCVIALRR